jgi:hypothetical protein
MEPMEILEAFDKTKSAHSAARLAGCDPKMARRLVARREAGLGANAPIERPRLVDGFIEVVDQLVDGSEGTIRADVAHEKPVACGYAGSPRTTRRAVGATANPVAEPSGTRLQASGDTHARNHQTRSRTGGG